jgi:hypothetical protein
MRTSRSTVLLDTKPERTCCVMATSAAELAARSGEKAKPNAASRTASFSDQASAPAIAAWCSVGNAAAVLANSA